MFNDLLQIEPFETRDYGVYSCLFVDEYGEKKLQFQVDEKLVGSGGGDENGVGEYETAGSSGEYAAESLDRPRVVARMGDLIIDVVAVKNVKNRIKIKCRNQFGNLYLSQYFLKKKAFNPKMFFCWSKF